MNSPTNYTDPTGYWSCCDFNLDIRIDLEDPFKGVREDIDRTWKSIFTDDVNRVIGYSVAIAFPYQSAPLLNTTTLFQDNFAFSQNDKNTLNTYYAGLAAGGAIALGGGYVASGNFSFVAALKGAVGNVGLSSVKSGIKSWVDGNYSWESFSDGFNGYFKYGEAPITDFTIGFIGRGFGSPLLGWTGEQGALGSNVAAFVKMGIVVGNAYSWSNMYEKPTKDEREISWWTGFFLGAYGISSND